MTVEQPVACVRGKNECLQIEFFFKIFLLLANPPSLSYLHPIQTDILSVYR